MVVELAGGGALGTGPTGEVLMSQVNMNLLGSQLQVHRGHTPRVFDAQNATVKLPIFHADWMTIHAAGVHGAPGQPGGYTRGVSAERFETPLVGGAACCWRRGGNPPAPAFPRRGKRERGRSNLLAAAGLCLRISTE